MAVVVYVLWVGKVARVLGGGLYTRVIVVSENEEMLEDSTLEWKSTVMQAMPTKVAPRPPSPHPPTPLTDAPLAGVRCSAGARHRPERPHRGDAGAHQRRHRMAQRTRA